MFSSKRVEALYAPVTILFDPRLEPYVQQKGITRDALCMKLIRMNHVLWKHSGQSLPVGTVVFGLNEGRYTYAFLTDFVLHSGFFNATGNAVTYDKDLLAMPQASASHEPDCDTDPSSPKHIVHVRTSFKDKEKEEEIEKEKRGDEEDGFALQEEEAETQTQKSLVKNFEAVTSKFPEAADQVCRIVDDAYRKTPIVFFGVKAERIKQMLVGLLDLEDSDIGKQALRNLDVASYPGVWQDFVVEFVRQVNAMSYWQRLRDPVSVYRSLSYFSVANDNAASYQPSRIIQKRLETNYEAYRFRQKQNTYKLTV